MQISMQLSSLHIRQGPQGELSVLLHGLVPVVLPMSKSWSC
jgi:hypothetical protein